MTRLPSPVGPPWGSKENWGRISARGDIGCQPGGNGPPPEEPAPCGDSAVSRPGGSVGLPHLAGDVRVGSGARLLTVLLGFGGGGVGGRCRVRGFLRPRASGGLRVPSVLLVLNFPRCSLEHVFQIFLAHGPADGSE